MTDKYKFNKKDNYYLTSEGYIHADLIKIAKSDAVKNMIKEYADFCEVVPERLWSLD